MEQFSIVAEKKLFSARCICLHKKPISIEIYLSQKTTDSWTNDQPYAPCCTNLILKYTLSLNFYAKGFANSNFKGKQLISQLTVPELGVLLGKLQWHMPGNERSWGREKLNSSCPIVKILNFQILGN